MQHYRAKVGWTIALAALAGCGQKAARIAFVATWPTVQWDAIARSGGSDREGYRVTIAQRTSGLFPAALAVARVRAVGEASSTGGGRLELDLTPAVDFLAWNTVFDDLRDISEVYPIAYLAMDGAPVSVDTIIEAADSQRAGLCLIYTQVLESIQDAQLRGALYDVAGRRQLATIHTSAHIEHPIALDKQDDAADLSADEREARDPRLVATRRFENQMRALLLKLRDNDDPAAPVMPDGWVPQYMEPAVWPPIEQLLINRARGGR